MAQPASDPSVTMPGQVRRATLAHTRHLHVERLRPKEPDLDEPELATAWRSLQLHWLATCPEYREEVKRRVSEAARRAESLARRIDREHVDVDYLGRELDGCG